MTATPGGAPTTTRALFDSFETMPELEPLRAALATGEWSEVEAALSSLGAEDVVGALEELARVEGVGRFLGRAVRTHPGSAAAATALARRYVQTAWNARLAAQRPGPDDKQRTTFIKHLTSAEQLLVQVCAEHPDYVPGWAVRQFTARGLELGASEARRRWNRLRALGPVHWPAAAELLLTLGPDWHGSTDDARAFVAETLTDAPDGSYAWALLPWLHIQQWSHESPGANQQRYFRDGAVAAQLRDAALRSVLHPAFRGGLLAPATHNLFAMAFWLGEHRGEAVHHVRAAGGRLTRSPWDLLAEPESVARLCRDAAMRPTEGKA